MHEPFFQWGAFRVQSHHQRYAEETDSTEGKIEVEDPTPCGVLDEQAANQWSSNGAKGPGYLVDTSVDRPLTEWHNVCHDDQAQSEDTTTTNSLNCATGQQFIEILGEATEYCANCEEEEGDEVEGATAKDVG